jgi:hypothetical protein
MARLLLQSTHFPGRNIQQVTQARRGVGKSQTEFWTRIDDNHAAWRASLMEVKCSERAAHASTYDYDCLFCFILIRHASTLGLRGVFWNSQILMPYKRLNKSMMLQASVCTASHLFFGYSPGPSGI